MAKAKLRVHELAKELGLENKAVIELCNQLGIEGKTSHSSSLTDEEGEAIRRSVIRKAVSEKTRLEKGTAGEGVLVTERRVGTVIRRRRNQVDEQQEAALAAEAAEIEAAAEAAKEEEQDAEGVSSVEDVQAAVEEIGEAASVESQENVEVTDSEQSGVNIIQSLRERHDVRAPKILGKIELRQTEQAVSVKAPKKQNAVAQPAAEQERGGSKFAKGKKKRVETFSDDDSDYQRKKKKRVQVLGKDDLLDYSDDRENWRAKKDKKGKKGKEKDAAESQTAMAPGKRVVKIAGEISVGELARNMSVKVGDVIAKLMGLGVMATINQVLDFDTATIIASDFEYTTVNTESDTEEMVKSLYEPDAAESLELRPPIVTVMGHVDHGKTSLLDAIRKTNVTKGEAGGITQHIGAYNVKLEKGGSVTFLDTPGHEAFTAMRSRGAKVTDIVVLVVAADDGFMPQTVEAINHAKAAEVPIIVAVNKIDKEGANIDRIKNQMSEQGLIPEDWGGDTIVVPVSAHTGQGIKELLENLYVQADVLELKANPNRSAIGAVVESKVERGRGTVMTVLVQNGTLKKGDVFATGAVFGRVKAMTDEFGKPVETAGPGMPVEVIGAYSTPAAGDDFIVFESEAKAKMIAEDRAARQKAKSLATKIAMDKGLSLERFSELVSSGEIKELPIIIKADVQGSVEAIDSALSVLRNEEVKTKIIHKAVGGVSENDVQLAVASKAVVVAFNVRADARAAAVAQEESVEIIYSRIIYELVDTIKSVLTGMLAPKFKETPLGRVEVRTTFKVPKIGTVAGSYVLDGIVKRDALVRLLRDEKVVYEGKLGSLRRFKDDVKEVKAGYECGIGIDGYSDIKDGDVIEVYKLEEVARELVH